MSRHINIRYISLNDRWVENEFYQYARDIVWDDYYENGKPVRTQKGRYRANYSNDVEKKYSDIIKLCCINGEMSSDFCAYADHFYPNPRARDLYGLIEDYISFRQQRKKNNMQKFMSECESLTPEEFFEIKDLQKGDIVGVYVIYNQSQDMYYIGQAKRVLFRINQHFTGHGNGDVYADYKYGDDFYIKIIKLSESGYSDIDLLERDLIEEYDAYHNGYNKTGGNGNY